MLLGQRLQHDEQRPRVVRVAEARVVDRAEPAVRPLRGQDPVHPECCQPLEPGVVQQRGQRDEPVQPVRAALPALGVSADPLASGYVRPEVGEVAGQPIGLDLELILEPARRAHLPERQRLKGP
jgi:hypothetical protein